MAELFGFSITRLKKQADPKQSFTTAQADDGTQTVSAGGHFGLLSTKVARYEGGSPQACQPSRPDHTESEPLYPYIT